MPRRSRDALQAQITGPLSPAKLPVANDVQGQRRQEQKTGGRSLERDYGHRMIVSGIRERVSAAAR